jgi:hypothetical protein
MPVSWYHHLHWVDVTIFVFAIIYVMAAVYILLLLCENATRKLAMVDVCHRPEERPLVSDTSDQTGASRTFMMRADSDTKVAVEVAPELMKSLKNVLHAHREHCSHLPEAARELLALELPGRTVDLIVDNVGAIGQSERKLEKEIRAFLSGEHTDVEIKCSPYERRHLHMLLQPLIDINVLAMVVVNAGASVTINKFPVATWFKEEAVNTQIISASKNTEPTYFRCVQIDLDAHLVMIHIVTDFYMSLSARGPCRIHHTRRTWTLRTTTTSASGARATSGLKN